MGAGEVNFEAAPANQRLFWVGQSSFDPGVARQLKRRFPNRFTEYPTAGNGNLSSGILNILK